MTTLVNLLHRFEQFVNAHQQITTFSHGQITDLDTFKETDFPVMHVVWNGATPTLENNGSGVMNWDFQVLFLDKPNINEDKTNQAKYVQSDCAQYALDLLATIRFGDIFDEDVEVASAGLQAITESFTNVLWGAALNLGLLTDYDVNYCDAPLDEISGGFTPCTLCGLIAGANAVQIVDCLSEAQEAAISALICPSTEPATYTNGAAFTQVIAGGETYTAPQVTMTAVDGTTEDIPANIDYTCEWKPITGQASDGFTVPSFNILSYPTGGIKVVGDFRVNDADGLFGEVPARERVTVENATLSAAASVSSSIILTIEVNVPVNNSNGDSVGGNVDDLLNPHVLPDLPVTDNDGAVGSYPMPTALAVAGQVTSAVYSAGTLTITPAGGAAPSGILYPDIAPATSYIDATAAGKDTVALWQAGAYTATKPTNPAVIACLDPTDATRSTMLNDNFYGNKYRWTDTAGNPSSVGTTAPSRYDWRNHNWAGAVQYLVIDHYLKAMYWVQFLTDAGKVAMRLDTGQSWYAWLNYIDGVTLGGYSDWLPIPLDTRLPHAAFSDIGQVGFRNFLICNRADGRGGVMTGESVDATYFYPFRDNFSFNLITSGPGGSAGAKAGLNSFSEGITDAYCMRILTDADIAALTP